MKAVTLVGFGGTDVLQLVDMPDPTPGPGDVVIDTVATALNRADLLQRQGHYPPPPGASEVLGLECSGYISAIGDGVTQWSIGDEVCALLGGGGYATKVAVSEGHVLPKPHNISLIEAASLPEAACTVWSNLVQTAHLQAADSFLCHGGSGGIGTFAIQFARTLGARVFATCSSTTEQDVCRSLGAELAIDYKDSDFVDACMKATNGKGVDVILDNMGASYLSRNIQTLAPDGRLVVIGLQGGTRAEIDFTQLMGKRATIASTALRSRSASDKTAIVRNVRDCIWPLLGTEDIRPVVDMVYPLEAVAASHEAMEKGGLIGKVILTTGIDRQRGILTEGDPP